MKFRVIKWVLLLTAGIYAGCGQAPEQAKHGTTQSANRAAQPATDGKADDAANATPTAERDPIDRHVEKLILTKHARCRMGCRHITEPQIRQILEKGEINYKKSDPDGNPDPKYALEGTTEEGQHLRVIFAVPKKRDIHALVVVTCIELGKEWACDCK